MEPSATADLAVLVAAVLTMVAIAGKLVTSSLMGRQQKGYAELDARRRAIAQRLKEAAAKRKSAEGTLHFWERRFQEAERKVLDVRLDAGEGERLVGERGGEADDPEEAAVPAAAPPAVPNSGSSSGDEDGEETDAADPDDELPAPATAAGDAQADEGSEPQPPGGPG